jgi:hypothetical protein
MKKFIFKYLDMVFMNSRYLPMSYNYITYVKSDEDGGITPLFQYHRVSNIFCINTEIYDSFVGMFDLDKYEAYAYFKEYVTDVLGYKDIMKSDFNRFLVISSEYFTR